MNFMKKKILESCYHILIYKLVSDNYRLWFFCEGKLETVQMPFSFLLGKNINTNVLSDYNKDSCLGFLMGKRESARLFAKVI